MKSLIPMVLTACFAAPLLAGDSSVPPREVRVIALSGSAHERGLQHGRLLRVEIARLVDLWKAELRGASADPDALIRRFLAETNFLPAIRTWTPDLLDEVRGIAEGSGQPFDTILAFQLVDELWVYLDRPAANHCSSLGVAASPAHPAFVAQNMDLESFRDGYQVVLRIAATGSAPEQLVFSSAGLIGVNGVNRRSVAIAANTLIQLTASPDGLPVAFVVRGVLAQADGVAALAFLRNVKHASGQNYVLGVGDRVFDLEASAGKVVELRPAAGGTVVYHTNHPLQNDDVKPWHRAMAQVRAAAGSGKGSSETRLESLGRRLGRGAGEIDADVIKETLRSKDSASYPVCRAVKAGSEVFTFGATVMTLSGRPSLEVTMGPPDANPFVRLSFSEEIETP
jgi:isopenicillin-N N-acyltransferase like protein